MRVSEILRQVANIVDANEEAASKEQEVLQMAQAAEIETAVTASQELQAGQVAQLVQAAQNAKAASGQDDVSNNSAPPVMPAVLSTDELTPCDNADDTEPATMVSPQQQELELLKKSQGIENNVSEFAISDEEADAKMEPTDQGEHNDKEYSSELAAMRKSAGIGEETSPHNYAEDLKPVSVNPRAEAARQFHKSRKARPE